MQLLLFYFERLQNENKWLLHFFSTFSPFDLLICPFIELAFTRAQYSVASLVSRKKSAPVFRRILNLKYF